LYVYSIWVVTNATSAWIANFSKLVGSSAATSEFQVEDGRVLSRAYEFSDEDRSLWVQSETQGTWTVAIAELVISDEVNPRLVGLLSPSAALTESLVSDFEELLENEGIRHDRAIFSLRAVLTGSSEAGLPPRSVRLQNDQTRILVQSEHEGALLENLGGLAGDVVGVTLRTKDATVTLQQDGLVIFADSTSLDTALRSIRLIETVMKPQFVRA
jgi:hypothetical protein